MPHQHTSYQLIPELWIVDQYGRPQEDITEIVLSGKVSYDQDRLIQKELSLKVSDPSRVRAYTDYLAPYLTVRYDDGYEVRRQLGQYVAVPPKRTVTAQQHHGFIEGRDMTWVVQQASIRGVGTSHAGALYWNSILFWIVEVGAGFRISIPYTPLVRPKTVSWPTGTSHLDIVNENLAAIGYYRLFTDNEGWLRSKPYLGLIREAEAAVTYDTVSPANRIQVLRDVEVDPLTDRICNRAIVIRDDPALEPLAVWRDNRNPDSPTSFDSLGMWITKIERDANIADYDTAVRRAQRMIDDGNAVYERLRLYTTPDPERGEHEVYDLNIKSESGATITGKYLCTGWSIGFTPGDGPMEHQLARVDTGPFGDDEGEEAVL